MRSPLGGIGSAIVLLALAAGIAAGILVGQTATEFVIHFGVGTGFVLVAVALFDFRLARWVTWLGAAAAGAFGAIFLLQGVSDLLGNDALHYVAFQLLGNAVERVLPVVLLVWFVALLFTGTSGRSRIVGWIILPPVIGLEVAAAIGVLVGIDVPFLKLHLFLPLVWLLVESIKSPADYTDARTSRSDRLVTTASA